MNSPLDGHLAGNYKESNFEFFKSFHREEDAIPYAELLKDNNIPFRFDLTNTIIDQAIVGSPIFPKYTIKILSEDFKRVYQIIEKEILRNAPNLPEHYLNELSDHQLLDLLKKPDETSIEDNVIAKEILKQRGIPVSTDYINEIKKERLTELQKGRDGNTFWMGIYLIMVIVGSVVLSPIMMMAGIGMGWYYWKDKQVDIDGNSFYTFNERTRFFGSVMLWIAALIVVVAILLAIIYGVHVLNPNQIFIGDFVR